VVCPTLSIAIHLNIRGAKLKLRSKLRRLVKHAKILITGVNHKTIKYLSHKTYLL
jgi:hypothetical protein